MTSWVLLRGLTREAAHWGGFADALALALQEATGSAHRFLCVDLPGNGMHHGQRSPLQVGVMAAAVRAELQRRGVDGPVVPVAMSLGAMVAIQWAATAPRELAGCVLINTSAGGFSPPWHRLQPRHYATLARMALAGATPLEREQAVLDMTSAHAERHGGLPAVWAAIGAQHPVSRANALRQIVAAARFRAPRNPPAVPGLVLASDGDRLVSPQCSRRLAQAWSWPLAMHAQAGHDLPLDAPDWVSGQITAWWQARVSGAGPGRAGRQ